MRPLVSIVSVVHAQLWTDSVRILFGTCYTYYPAVIVVTFASTLYSVVEGQTAEVQLNSSIPAETEYTIQVVQVDGREWAHSWAQRSAITTTSYVQYSTYVRTNVCSALCMFAFSNWTTTSTRTHPFHVYSPIPLTFLTPSYLPFHLHIHTHTLHCLYTHLSCMPS